MIFFNPGDRTVLLYCSLLWADSQLCTASLCKIRQINIKERFKAGPGNHLKSQFPGELQLNFIRVLSELASIIMCTCLCLMEVDADWPNAFYLASCLASHLLVHLHIEIHCYTVTLTHNEHL